MRAAEVLLSPSARVTIQVEHDILGSPPQDILHHPSTRSVSARIWVLYQDIAENEVEVDISVRV